MVLCDTDAVVLFHCLYYRLCGHVTLWWVYLHSISLLLYWYLPYKLAKFYTEYEPHGKKMHVFIGDYLIYFWDFKLNKKAIYHEDRIEPVEEIVFEKTNL